MQLRPIYLLSGVLMLTMSSVTLSAQKNVPSTADGIPALSAPFMTITYPGAKPRAATSPFFSHGYLVQFQHHNNLAGASNIYLWNSSGQLAHELAIWQKGVTSLFLTSVDVGASQHLAFAGRARKADGSEFAFIATSNLDGKDPQYINTGRYLPTLISEADDGSIWAVGVVEHDEATDAQRWVNYDTVRHYSSNGALIGHYLSRWGNAVAYTARTTDRKGDIVFAAYDSQANPVTSPSLHKIWGYMDAWKASRHVFLKSSGTLTVLYDGLNDRLCKHDTVTNKFSCSIVSGTYSNSMSPTGFALTKEGGVYTSMKSSGPDHDAERGLFVLSPHAADSRLEWAAVPGTMGNAFGEGDFISLLGSDESSLVYRRKQAKGYAVATVSKSQISTK